MLCAGDYGRNPVITMGVCSVACVCRDAKHDGIYPCLIWIALQNNRLDSTNAGASLARIAHLRELVFCGSKSFFVCVTVSTAYNCMSNQRTIKEFTNQRDCVSR